MASGRFMLVTWSPRRLVVASSSPRHHL